MTIASVTHSVCADSTELEGLDLAEGDEAIAMIKQGGAAPDFDLEADDGSRVSLASLRGRKVVLFFYPKDNTSG